MTITVSCCPGFDGRTLCQCVAYSLKINICTQHPVLFREEIFFAVKKNKTLSLHVKTALSPFSWRLALMHSGRTGKVCIGGEQRVADD